MAQGKKHKIWKWHLKCGSSNVNWKQEWEVRLAEDYTLQFTIDGEGIFNDAEMEKDFEYTLPVSGALKLDQQYEVKLPVMHSADMWYPATLTEARSDGNYSADALMPPDQYGHRKKVYYPKIGVDRIRDPFTMELVQVPSSMIRLLVKKDGMFFPELTINGLDFTRYISVPTPASTRPPAEINLTVNKDRTNVTADVGHEKLKDALDATRPENNVRSGTCKRSELKCEWKIHIGAFGEHCIVAEAKSAKSKRLDVSIDGNLVVSGSASDLGGNSRLPWCADIAIQGHLALKYKLHKTSSNAMATDETTTVTQKLLHSNIIRITCPDITNLECATLECDDVEFAQLCQYEAMAESTINCRVDMLESAHDISVPYTLQALQGRCSKGGFAAKIENLFPGGSSLLSLFSNTFTPFSNMACCKKSGDTSEIVLGGEQLPPNQFSEEVLIGNLGVYQEAASQGHEDDISKPAAILITKANPEFQVDSHGSWQEADANDTTSRMPFMVGGVIGA